MNIVTPRDYKAIDLNRCPEGMSADTVSCSCRAKDLLHRVQACFEASRERRGLCFQPCTLETRKESSKPLVKAAAFRTKEAVQLVEVVLQGKISTTPWSNAGS